MDIDLEKEKARYAYKLEMRKLVIDKVLIGIIVAVVGWQINIAFERYKNQLGTERFLLEKRLEAVSAVRNTYSQLHDMYIDLTTADTKGKIHLPNDYKQKYDNYITELIRTTNKNTPLLSEYFANRIDNFVWIYQGFLDNDAFNPAERNYRPFAVDLSEYFDFLSREEILGHRNTKNDKFEFTSMDWKKAELLGGGGVLEVRYGEWQRWIAAQKESK